MLLPKETKGKWDFMESLNVMFTKLQDSNLSKERVSFREGDNEN